MTTKAEPTGKAKCRYCNRVGCESHKYRDSAKLLRECRHAVQLERDFLENRVRRLEGYEAQYKALRDQALSAPTAETDRCSRCKCAYLAGSKCPASNYSLLCNPPEPELRLIGCLCALGGSGGHESGCRCHEAQQERLPAPAQVADQPAPTSTTQTGVCPNCGYGPVIALPAPTETAPGRRAQEAFHKARYGFTGATSDVDWETASSANKRAWAAVEATLTDPRLAHALANPPGPRHARLVDDQLCSNKIGGDRCQLLGGHADASTTRSSQRINSGLTND